MEPQEQIRQVQKKYCSIAMLVAVSVAVVLVLAGHKPVGKGLVLGTVFSSLNFILMGETLPKRISGSRRRASVASGISIFIRYVLLAAPLIIAIKYSAFNIAATVVGLFMIQIMILATQGIYASTRKNLDY